MLLIAFIGLEAKPKQNKEKMDPEFEQFINNYSKIEKLGKVELLCEYIKTPFTFEENHGSGEVFQTCNEFINFDPDWLKIGKFNIKKVKIISKTKPYIENYQIDSDSFVYIINGLYFAKFNNKYKYFFYYWEHN